MTSLYTSYGTKSIVYSMAYVHGITCHIIDGDTTSVAIIDKFLDSPLTTLYNASSSAGWYVLGAYFILPRFSHKLRPLITLIILISILYRIYRAYKNKRL